MNWNAILSLFFLFLVILAGSLRPRVNAGILAIGAAYLVYFITGNFDPAAVAKGFPDHLFLMLIGITLLFSIAEKNGTLEKITSLFLKLAKGKAFLLPFIYFFLSFLLSAIGPGNIAATALLAPSGMVVAHRSGNSLLLMAIMICTGANAGAFSPVAPTGIISTGLLQKIGITDSFVPVRIFLSAAAIQSITAILAFFIFTKFSTIKGAIISAPAEIKIIPDIDAVSPGSKNQNSFFSDWTLSQILTLISIITLIILVLVFQISVGPVSFILVSLLWLSGADKGELTLKDIPWDAIFLLTGIAILISVLEKSGGLDLVVSLLGNVSSKNTVNAILALVTGLTSAFSSSSGVIMPAFIPMIPGIQAKTGAEDAIDLAIAICAGSHMVDVSPLSTLGALCIASSPINEVERSKLFRSLLLWGLTMALAGTLLAFLFLDILKL